VPLTRLSRSLSISRRREELDARIWRRKILRGYESERHGCSGLECAGIGRKPLGCVPCLDCPCAVLRARSSGLGFRRHLDVAKRKMENVPNPVAQSPRQKFNWCLSMSCFLLLSRLDSLPAAKCLLFGFLYLGRDVRYLSL